jgi:hypothetical protein
MMRGKRFKSEREKLEFIAKVYRIRQVLIDSGVQTINIEDWFPSGKYRICWRAEERTTACDHCEEKICRDWTPLPAPTATCGNCLETFSLKHTPHHTCYQYKDGI